MGMSITSTIAYGIALDEDKVYPWQEDDEGVEEWWLKEQGFKPSREAYDSEGDRLPCITEEDVNRYFTEKFRFLEKNPMPVEIEQRGQSGYPLYVAVLPQPMIVSYGYDADVVDFGLLEVTPDKRGKFIEFRDKYLDTDEEPTWLLYRYYG
jgi:hypothetical protein